MTRRTLQSSATGTDQRRPLAALVTCVGILMQVTSSLGAPPLEPTGPPVYSFDASSPKVLDGTLAPADLLVPGPEGQNPNRVLQGAALGLLDIADDLDGLSTPNSSVGPNDEFAILFSIDRQSVGGVAPDPAAVNSDIPYNAQDQAEKMQAAGDQFLSLTHFTGTDGPLPLGGGRAIENNTLLRNNFDEGGVDFSADPPVSAEQSAARAAQDNVDATMGTALGDGAVGPLFFTATSDSPSLPLLTGVVESGANIYFNANPALGAGENQLFASAGDLGLVSADDISAMVIFDRDANGAFGAQDQVLFSLAPGSPSLPTVVAGRASSPADVFSVSGTGAVSVFATAANLGLDASFDNIDALDVLPCVTPDTCDPARHAIRRLPVPTVSTWGLVAMSLLLLTAGSVIFLRRRVRLT